MIWWFTGNTGSGKTTLARKVNAILLDGDDLRKVWKLGFNEADRRENNLRAARLARMLSNQGYDVVVATICPYQDLRNEVQQITGCKFVYFDEGADNTGETPYENNSP